jgi:hypothetical protein
LEDLLWEHNYSAYNHEEYLTIRSYLTKPNYQNLRSTLREPYFFKGNLISNLQDKPLLHSIITDLSLTGDYYGNTINNDELMNNSTLTLSTNFNFTPLTTSLFLLDDSYENWNELRAIHFQNFLPPLLQYTSFYKPQPLFNVVNLFRADFLDFNWLLTTVNLLKIKQPYFNLISPLTIL